MGPAIEDPEDLRNQKGAASNAHNGTSRTPVPKAFHDTSGPDVYDPDQTTVLPAFYKAPGPKVYDPDDPTQLKQAEDSAAVPEASTSSNREGKLLENPRVKERQKRNPVGKTNSESSNDSKKARRWLSRRNIYIGSGGGLIGIVFALIFTTSFPAYKIVSLMANVDKAEFKLVNYATHQTEKNIANDWVRHMLQGLDKGYCTSTFEPNCIGPIACSNPVTCALKAMKEDHAEKLLTDKRMAFVKENGKLYFVTDAEEIKGKVVGGTKVLGNADLRSVEAGQFTIWEVGDAGKIKTLNNARALLDIGFDDATPVQRLVRRFFTLPLTSNKYADAHCIFACNIRAKIAGTIEEKQKAFWAATYRNLIEPIIPEWAKMFAQCFLGGNADFCSDVLQSTKPPGAPADETKLTPAQQQLKSDLLDFKANNLDLVEGVSEMAANAEKNADKGFFTLITEKALAQVFGEDTAETMVKTGADAASIVGLVLVIAQLGAMLDHFGAKLQHLRYALTIDSGVKLYDEVSSIASEAKSGHTDATVMGSVVRGLSTNMLGTPTGQADYTDSPLYNTIIGGGNPASSAYKCDNGLAPAAQPSIPGFTSNGIVCPEERTDLYSPLLQLDQIIRDVPNMNDILNASEYINKLNDLFGWIISGAFQKGCDIINAFSGNACTNATTALLKAPLQAIQDIANLVLASPINDNMSGARTFDMIAMGADATANKSCQINLGCGQVTNQQAQQISSAQDAADRTAFDHLPLSARIFSVDTPYSLVSRVAVALPASPALGLQRGFASLLSNPFSGLASLFSSIFARNHAFAASVPDDPFGIIRYGYTPDQIPKDPEVYYHQHCEGRDYDTPWYNNQPQSEITGEAVATYPEACKLISTVATSIGGVYNPSQLPKASQNPDNGGSGIAGGVGCGGKGQYSALVSYPVNFAGIDQGIDFTPANAPGFDICAPAAGTIVYLSTKDCFFAKTPGCTQVREKLDQPPNAPSSSQYIYYAEIISIASGIQIGGHVNAGTVIGHNAQNPGIEVGWAGGANGPWLCGLGGQTPCGTSFNNWILGLSHGVTF